ncbi:hypothetical protein BC826DRAFT_185856 [Russula brevipes]|nr:hypothetical protein BC826DRAFT_185856 [Russula brevipes]
MHLPLLDLLRSLSFTALDILVVKLISSSFFALALFFSCTPSDCTISSLPLLFGFVARFIFLLLTL